MDLSFIKKITDFIMPLEPIEEEEPEQVVEQPKQKRVEQQQQTVVQKTVDETVTKTVPIFEPEPKWTFPDMFTLGFTVTKSSIIASWPTVQSRLIIRRHEIYCIQDE